MYPHASQQADAIVPPHAEATDKNQLLTFAVTTGSQDVDLTTTARFPILVRESHWVSFQPVGGDVYVRFKKATGGTTVTVDNGYKIADGFRQDFWIRHGRDTVVEIIGSVACTLRFWISDQYGGPLPTSV